MRDTHPARPEPAPTWPLTGEQPVARVPRAPRHGHPRLWRAVRALLALLLLVLVALGFGYWRLSKTVTDFPGAHFNTGKNAVWLEHAWAGQPHSAAEFDQLANRLGREQITYVFAHVGPLESDGAIPADRAPDAGVLAAQLHTRLPNLKILAWIGQVEIAGGYPADESVDLADSSVRAGIVHTAAHFVNDLGYDGVHYDIEPIVNNNNHFLDLLDETHAALPAGAIVSVSAQKWAPNATVASLIHDIGRADAWWTSFYYAAVAKHADQIVAMLYNTAMPTASAYQLAVKQETANILEAARSPNRPPEVLIGLPTYPGNGFWYHDTAENMRTGLNGVIAGLNSDTETAPFTGVAIYRYALTSDSDWSTYEAMWLGK
ncbi:MAG TPA: glycosyl hydrolase family 18 protein [Ktedonobacterales bacterium]|nr:glycosyl hydrolase family 18 protein [Ktedonobacterales bacterium]